MRIVCSERDGHWAAHAEREGTGDPFGPEYEGPTEQEAVARLTAWLDWQREHAAALEALQQTERAYHRVLMGSAFAGSAESSSALDLQRESLEALESARIRLDEVRGRKPA